MGLEIERRFKVEGEAWRRGRGKRLSQGYLSTGLPTVRVRLQEDEAWLTIKGPTRGASRAEFEYAIPLSDAKELLRDHCVAGPVEKTRFTVPHEGTTWVVDLFHGSNAPLVLAEVELASEDESFARPPWLGEEVTGDFRYSNSRLAEEPYSTWVEKR